MRSLTFLVVVLIFSIPGIITQALLWSLFSGFFALIISRTSDDYLANKAARQ
jgi:hypothetical protein